MTSDGPYASHLHPAADRTTSAPHHSVVNIRYTVKLCTCSVSLLVLTISLVIHGLCWTVSAQVKVHVLQICTNGASPNHLLAIVASDRPWATLSTRAHWRNLKADWIYSTKRMMTQSYGWKPQRLQHSRNEWIMTSLVRIANTCVTNGYKRQQRKAM